MRHTEYAGHFKGLYYLMMKEVSVRRVQKSARKDVSIKLILEDTSLVMTLSEPCPLGLGMRLTQLLVQGHVNLLHVNLI